MKKILIIMVAATMLLGCQKEKSPTIDSGDGSVKFTSGIATRASGTQWANSDEIGVYMLKNADKAVIEGNIKYKNVAAAGATAAFETITPIYYPFIGNVNFLAYYPYNLTALTEYAYPLNVIDQTNLPSIDLMTAEKLNVQKTGQTQDLTFNHKLSNIKLTIVGGEGLVGANFTGLTVKLIGTKATGTYNIDTDFIALTGDAAEITLQTTTDGNSAEGIVIPQSFTDVKLIFKLDGKVDAVATIASGTFESGNKHAYTVTLTRNAAKLSGTITPWGNGTGGDLDALPSIPLFTIVASPAGAEYDYVVLDSPENNFLYDYSVGTNDESQSVNLAEYTTVNNSSGEIEIISSVFLEEGLPAHIVTPDYTIVIENYEGNQIDFIIVTTETPTTISQHIDVETSIDWGSLPLRPETGTTGCIVFDQKAIISVVDAICGTLENSVLDDLSSLEAIGSGGLLDEVNDIILNATIGTFDDIELPSGYPGTAEGYVNEYTTDVNDVSVSLQEEREEDIVLGTGYLTTGTGEVKITLSWDCRGDVDIYCKEPDGTIIYFRNETSDSGGELDKDNLDGPAIENIFWKTDPPKGEYEVYIKNFDNVKGNYTVIIKNGNIIKTYKGILHSGQGSDEKIPIDTFEVL